MIRPVGERKILLRVRVRERGWPNGFEPRMRRQVVAWRREPQVRRRWSRKPLDFLKTELRRSDTVAKPITTARRFSNRCLAARPCRPVWGLRQENFGYEGRWCVLARTWGSRRQATTCRRIRGSNPFSQPRSLRRMRNKSLLFPAGPIAGTAPPSHQPRAGVGGIQGCAGMGPSYCFPAGSAHP